MQFEPTKISEVVLIRPRVWGDPRGFLFESWEERKFAAAGLGMTFVQDNHSRSGRHVLRGLHYQILQGQGKLVRVVSGTVFDVAIDVRRRSSTFGHSVGVVLSGDNHHMLWVPSGFAHGFLVLSDRADFSFRCTDFWAPTQERTIIWNDPDLNIPWPLPPGATPVLSSRDAAGASFRDAEYLP